MIAMLFQTLHLGAKLSLWERCCLQSFADCEHEIIVFGYDRFDLPAGVRWAAAREIVSEKHRNQFLRDAPDAFNRFANLFRDELLQERGSWWIDTDVLCLGRDVPDEEIVLGWEDADRMIGNAIMRMPAGHELLREAASRAWSERQVEIWGHTGPRLLTELVRQHQLTQSVRRPPDLYPIHHSAAFDLIDPDACSMVEAVVANCPFLHFWHQKFRAGGFQTDFLPPQGSYLGDVFQRHGGRGKLALDGAAAQRQIKVVRDERAWRNAAAQLGAELDGLKRSRAPS